MDFRNVDMIIYKFFAEEFGFPYPIVLAGYRQQVFTPGEDSPEEYMSISRQGFNTAYRPSNRIMCVLTYQLVWRARDPSAISPLEQLDITSFRYYLFKTKYSDEIKFNKYVCSSRNNIASARTEPWTENIATLTLATEIATYKNYKREKYAAEIAKSFTDVVLSQTFNGQDTDVIWSYKQVEKENENG